MHRNQAINTLCEINLKISTVFCILQIVKIDQLSKSSLIWGHFDAEPGGDYGHAADIF